MYVSLYSDVYSKSRMESHSKAVQMPKCVYFKTNKCLNLRLSSFRIYTFKKCRKSEKMWSYKTVVTTDLKFGTRV